MHIREKTDWLQYTQTTQTKIPFPHNSKINNHSLPSSRLQSHKTQSECILKETTIMAWVLLLWMATNSLDGPKLLPVGLYDTNSSPTLNWLVIFGLNFSTSYKIMFTMTFLETLISPSQMALFWFDSKFCQNQEGSEDCTYCLGMLLYLSPQNSITRGREMDVSQNLCSPARNHQLITTAFTSDNYCTQCAHFK